MEVHLRFLVIAAPRTTVPPDMLVGMLDRAEDCLGGSYFDV